MFLCPQERAFAIPELLEMFVAELSMRELLLAQRTCRAIRVNIMNSEILQRGLFFIGEKSRHVKPGGASDNPLLLVAFSPRFLRHFVGPLVFYQGPVEPRHQDLMEHYRKTKGKPNNEDVFRSLPWYQNEERRNAFVRPEASWRRMLIWQPPMQVLEVAYLTEGQNGGFDRHYWSAEGGVRMGAFYDLVWQWVFEEKASSSSRSFGLVRHGIGTGSGRARRRTKQIGIASKGAPTLGLYHLVGSAEGHALEPKKQWSRLIKSEAFDVPQLVSHAKMLQRKHSDALTG